MRVGLAFSKFVDCKGIGDNGKVGIGFYMCLCSCWRQVVMGNRVGANSMVMADWEILGLGFIDSRKI